MQTTPKDARPPPRQPPQERGTYPAGMERERREPAAAQDKPRPAEPQARNPHHQRSPS